MLFPAQRTQSWRSMTADSSQWYYCYMFLVCLTSSPQGQFVHLQCFVYRNFNLKLNTLPQPIALTQMRCHYFYTLCCNRWYKGNNFYTLLRYTSCFPCIIYGKNLDTLGAHVLRSIIMNGQRDCWTELHVNSDHMSVNKVTVHDRCSLNTGQK